MRKTEEWIVISGSTVVLLACLCFPFSAVAETLVLKSGQSVKGRILEKTDEYIKIDFYGVPLTYYIDEIKSIDKDKDQVKRVSTPQHSAKSGAEKSPEKIYEEVSPGIVIVTAQKSAGFSLGSGFIIRENGVVMTNFHVVGAAETIEVKLKDGRVYPVSGIVDYSPNRDVCVLKIEASNLPIVKLGDSDSLKPGQKILVIGAPQGYEYSITNGLFSGIRNELGQRVIQFSAPISPGNSGGPLLNMQGEVVGITTYMRTDAQNLNFAIPMNEVLGFISAYPKITMNKFSAAVGKAYSFYSSAQEAFFLGNNIDTAIDCFKKAIEVDPNYIWAYSDLAAIYGNIGRVDEEIALCQKAIAIAPEYQAAHMNLGVAYQRKGMHDEAKEELEKAISLNPDDAQAHDNLGVAYENKGMLDEAVNEHKKAIELDPYYAVAYANLSKAYANKEMHQEALDSAKKAVALAPNDGMAQNNLAVAYYTLSEYGLALEHCDKALQLGYKVHPEFLRLLEQYRKKPPSP